MKITVFTSNQPRHLSLINGLAEIAGEVFAVIEANTILPGKKADFFLKSEVMQEYFGHVINSESRIFGNVSFLSSKVSPLILKSGDLNDVHIDVIKPCLKSDRYVVFGASYIKGALIDILLAKRALNIHMGVSPYYRGSSCNFWAAYDGNIDLVGATIHLLSKGLDSGDMLFHALPSFTENPFDLGMKAVKSAHTALIEYIKTGEIDNFIPVPQNKLSQIRYTKNKDFNDIVAKEYINNLPSSTEIKMALNNADKSKYLHPFMY